MASEDVFKGFAFLDSRLHPLVGISPEVELLLCQLLVMITLVADFLYGQLVESASVQVYLLHPVVHGLAEGGKFLLHAECLMDELGISMYIDLAEGQSLADEQIIEKDEEILAVECPVSQRNLIIVRGYIFIKEVECRGELFYWSFGQEAG